MVNSMATIYDVAKKAEVSIATVSAVLNRTAYVSPELTKRVKAAVQELDYTINHLAHSLQKKSTRTIGMLIPGENSLDEGFGEIVRGAEDVLRDKGYLLMLGHTYNKMEHQSRYLAAFRARMVDGVMLCQAPGYDPELQRMLEKRRPLVFVGHVPDVAADAVASEIGAGIKLGVDHLIRQGHKRIGVATTVKNRPLSSARIEGWKLALGAHGLAPEPSLILKTAINVDATRAAANKWLRQKPRPTAIFVDHPLTTMGILEAVYGNGLRCPVDFQLLSSDEVVQPAYEMGTRAAELLLKRIRHPRRAFETVMLRPRLRIRG
jgi:LacI family transcriptional regulator